LATDGLIGINSHGLGRHLYYGLTQLTR